jgi:hypothetical protein
LEGPVGDTPAGTLPGGIRPVTAIDFRAPISSACTADPFTSDGSNCPGGAPDSPFVLVTRALSPQALFAGAVGPCAIFVGCLGNIHVSAGQATITTSLGQNAPVGILVQKILSQRKVNGVLVRKLKLIGRVPLGNHKKGGVKIHWNLRVNGRKLSPGRYLVTLRAFSKRHKLIALSQPVVIRIR